MNGGDRLSYAGDLKSVIDSIPALIWCAAAEDGSLVYANQRLCNYAGVTPEAVKGWDWAPLVHPDDLENTKAAWGYCFRNGVPLDITQRLRRADGEYRWFQTLAEPLRDAANQISQWYGLNIDIHDRKCLAEALRASELRLANATQIATVAELAASIAHEINQPLGAIAANASACEVWLSSDPPNTERARSAAQRIIRDGSAAAEVIERIRALFKQAAPNKVRLDLNGVLHEVLQLISAELTQKDIILDTVFDSALPMVDADRIQMQQVISNLIHNAIESMEEVWDRSRRLIVRSRSEGYRSIVVEICDQGAGINDIERVFEPFFTTKERGMGLGLSICKSIIDSHEGVLRVEPNGDYGTIASFSLPIGEKTT